jgi:hypothetical protein
MCKPTFLTTYGPTIVSVAITGAVLFVALFFGGQ